MSLCRVVGQLFGPKFLNTITCELHTNQWVSWIALAASTLIFKVFDDSNSAPIARIESFIRTPGDAHSVANLKRGSINIDVGWLGYHPGHFAAFR